MREFTVSIRSFQDVKDFVSLATIQPFRVLVGNGRQWVNAKSFMGMFSLDFRAGCEWIAPRSSMTASMTKPPNSWRNNPGSLSIVPGIPGAVFLCPEFDIPPGAWYDGF